jgi:hypothetical protein
VSKNPHRFFYIFLDSGGRALDKERRGAAWHHVLPPLMEFRSPTAGMRLKCIVLHDRYEEGEGGPHAGVLMVSRNRFLPLPLAFSS